MILCSFQGGGDWFATSFVGFVSFRLPANEVDFEQSSGSYIRINYRARVI